MKTPVRFQSRLLTRRSYKPARASRRTIGITFRPTQSVVVPVMERRHAGQSVAAALLESVPSG